MLPNIGIVTIFIHLYILLFNPNKAVFFFKGSSFSLEGEGKGRQLDPLHILRRTYLISV